MRVVVNPDKELVEEIRRELKENDGYCPCRIEKTPDTRCMCREFREKLGDPSFYGECHCGLYVKLPDDDNSR